MRDRALLPLVAIAAFNLDFLCIHPFRDGNGRASRLLLLLQSYQSGFEIGRYISLELVCPGVSRDMIRNVLRSMRDEGDIVCMGRGPGAKWQRISESEKRGNVSKKG